MRTALCAIALSVLSLVGEMATAKVRIEILPAPDDLFEQSDGAEVIRPAEGEILVIGWIEHPDFAIAEVGQMAVEAPDGRRLPMLVESDLLYEFDRIVRARVAFAVPADTVLSSGSFFVEWGPGVTSENRKVGRMALDPSMRDRYRTFRVVRSETAPEVPLSSSIEVVAESHADYYFLWYLLPMAVIFIVLTVRRIHARLPDR